jgi:hypothetical protein
LGLAVTASGGCMSLGPTSPVSGTSGFTFDSGWASQGFLASEEQVREALNDTMADLKMRPLSQSRADPAISIIDAQLADGRHARITLRSLDTGLLVAIRIGRFGDEKYAQAILQRIGIRLGTLPAEAIPDEPPTSGSFGSRLFSKDAVPDAEMLPDQANAGYRDTMVP